MKIKSEKKKFPIENRISSDKIDIMTGQWKTLTMCLGEYGYMYSSRAYVFNNFCSSVEFEIEHKIYHDGDCDICVWWEENIMYGQL